MQESATQWFSLPPQLHTAQGEMRRVGVELEMSGITLERLAEVVAQTLGLKVHQQGRYVRTLSGDPAGDWRVEIDFHLLQSMGNKNRDAGDFADEIAVVAEDILSRVSDNIVPLELISPPLPMARVSEFTALVTKLRAAGALGTSARAISAFGLQLNPELPALTSTTILRYLRAFICLEPWLRHHSEVNITRRMTNYAAQFPTDYAKLIVAESYQPELRQLIHDFIDANPTRNRSLDCLPLFLELAPDIVNSRCPDPLIKARPTFHYRLPNCEIHKPNWGVHLAWQDWLQVELLATDQQRLSQCCDQYSRYLRNPLRRWFGSSWRHHLEDKWLI